eukprot:CAMPEP_0180043852 /NCGR_PEP_ID=MMETSP0984-20121128/35614_1 /TAXON_ID=483367 /ORGANISM="non described non described, Strain CCMP 2436" /LENGTH=73 /DNA_ID=CAMNT_0021971987 /DNA_START=127 /DNA_END=346 /DNA_ORIENTATION=-
MYVQLGARGAPSSWVHVTPPLFAVVVVFSVARGGLGAAHERGQERLCEVAFLASLREDARIDGCDLELGQRLP